MMVSAMRFAALAVLAGAVLLPMSAGAGQADAKPVYSDAAALGKLMFFDASLSASGKMSCASCHSPSHAYGPPNGLAAQLGGPDMRSQGTRAVPSLRYV
ncbi:cytochrome c peroxidase, partial [Paraburkholderia sediminicola]